MRFPFRMKGDDVQVAVWVSIRCHVCQSRVPLGVLLGSTNDLPALIELPFPHPMKMPFGH